MKKLIYLLPFVLSACGPSVTLFEPTQLTDGSVRMSPAVAVSANIEGSKITLRSPSNLVEIEGAPDSVIERVILNKKGDAVLAMERRPGLARIDVSGPIDSYGEAGKKVGNTITQGVATGIVAGALGGAVVPAIGKAP